MAPGLIIYPNAALVDPQVNYVRKERNAKPNTEQGRHGGMCPCLNNVRSGPEQEYKCDGMSTDA